MLAHRSITYSDPAHERAAVILMTSSSVFNRGEYTRAYVHTYIQQKYRNIDIIHTQSNTRRSDVFSCGQSVFIFILFCAHILLCCDVEPVVVRVADALRPCVQESASVSNWKLVVISPGTMPRNKEPRNYRCHRRRSGVAIVICYTRVR